MKKITLILTITLVLLSTNLFSQGKNLVTKKFEREQKERGIYFAVPELYIGIEDEPGKIMYSASVLGCYNFPRFGSIGIKIGNYKSQNYNLLASPKSTTRIMGGYIGSMVSILAGVDLNEPTKNQEGYNTPIIETRFIWPTLLYEEALLLIQPEKEKLLFKNRLGLGLFIFELAWEYEIINIENETRTRNAAFVSLFHVLTFSWGKNYFYGGIRLII